MTEAKTAKIKLLGLEAIYTTADHLWHCEDKSIEELLNRILKNYLAPGWVANLPLDVARYTVSITGGEVIAADPVDVDELRPLG